jgi:hypothetical protein
MGATNPAITWAGQATLSPTGDSCVDEDPENSGYGTVQVAVWEHETSATNHDIYMNYSLSDGATGTWSFPVAHPAVTNMDEKNPAVCVTRNHTGLGQEIHVVYQRLNAGPPAYWEICHTFTNNFGITWSNVTVLSTANVDSYNPACVYTEDLCPGPGGGGVIGFLCQVVWEEDIGSSNTQIMYDAFVYDPTWFFRGTLTGGPFVIRTANFTANLPEIASVDDNVNNSAYNYQFSIVWQEQNSSGSNWNIWYTDGMTGTSPSVVVRQATGSLGQINPTNTTSNHTEPDIAATQDYQFDEVFYFHIDYLRVGSNATPLYIIESHYCRSGFWNPGATSFIRTNPVKSNVIAKDNPTVASKLTLLNPTVFDTWFAWEDANMTGSVPNIWYRVGQEAPGTGFSYLVPAARVPIVPLGRADSEYNPEFWNRNDASRSLPPLTHLVCDIYVPGLPNTHEVEYIDP